MTRSLVIAAGGTGGHLVPALAVADAIRGLAPDAAISFIGARSGLERELIPRAGYPIATTSVRAFGGGLGAVVAGASLVPATAQARRVLARTGAGAVLGMGGYPSLPAVIAARLLRLPSLIHEQNAVPGLANQLAARFTSNVAVSFAQTVEAFGPAARLVGLPMRDAIVRGDRASLRPGALGAFGLADDRLTVLIFGGSLGAARINAAALELAESWRDRDDVQLLIAAGRTHADDLRRRMPEGKLVSCVAPFIERMELAYAAADVVVCRAGASTVHELASVGLPALLVPYPYARRREQHHNARPLADAGAAEVLEDAAVTGALLDQRLGVLLRDGEQLARMAQRARAVAMPGAAEAVARWVLELAEAGRG